MRISAKIGAIEFAGNEVRLAIVKTGGRMPSVIDLRTAQVNVTEPEDRIAAMAQAVKDVLKQIHGRPQAFVLCASSEFSLVRSLTLPFRNRKRVAATVPFELEPYLAVPIEDLEIDFTLVQESQGETEVLAVGVRRAPLEEQLAALAAAGLDPDAINIDGLGLTALWMDLHRGQTGLNAVLHVRKTTSSLAIVNNKTLLYMRPLAINASHLQENPRSAAREVQNSIRAFLAGWKGGGEVASLSVTGIDLFEDERRLFEEEFRIPVTFENMRSQLKVMPKTAAQPAAEIQAEAHDTNVSSAVHAVEEGNYWEAIIGVALAASGGACSFNFRKGRLQQRRPWKRLTSHLVATGCLAFMLLLAYLGYWYFDYRANMAQMEEIGAELWNLYTEMFPDAAGSGSRPADDIGGARTFELMRKELENRSGMVGDIPTELFAKTPLLDILSEIAAKMPDDKVRITELKVTGGKRSEIRITGEGRVSGAINDVVEDLKTSTVLQIDPEWTGHAREGKETFTIVAKW